MQPSKRRTQAVPLDSVHDNEACQHAEPPASHRGAGRERAQNMHPRTCIISLGRVTTWNKFQEHHAGALKEAALGARHVCSGSGLALTGPHAGREGRERRAREHAHTPGTFDPHSRMGLDLHRPCRRFGGIDGQHAAGIPGAERHAKAASAACRRRPLQTNPQLRAAMSPCLFPLSNPALATPESSTTSRRPTWARCCGKQRRRRLRRSLIGSVACRRATES